MVNSVSVIIPVRNGVHFIEASINSVLTQTKLPHEVIVVDDGSTDGTRELVLARFSGKVKLIDGPCEGAGPARNKGVQASSSELIAFLDADDIWHEEKLQKQLSVFKPGTILGSYAYYFVFSKRQKRVFGTSVRTTDDNHANNLIFSGSALPCLLSSWLLEREVFLSIGGFDRQYVYAQDFEFALRASRAGHQFQVLREPLLDYQIHQSSETFTNYIEQRMYAEYSRYVFIKGGHLSYETWLGKEWTGKRQRHAVAGYFFRLALSKLGKTVPIASVFYLFLALVLDPLAFASKLLSQARIGTLFSSTPLDTRKV